MNFFVYKASNGQYYFTIETSTNHKVLATSETYWNKADAIHACNLIKSGASGALVVDMTKAA
jgi:uncharacterized protein YegP (UPF0339 family)